MSLDEVPVAKFGYVKKETLNWLRNHTGILTGSAIGLFALLVGASRLVSDFHIESQAGYLAARISQEQAGGNKESLLKLQKLMHKYPELHKKYEGVIAQRLEPASEPTSYVASPTLVTKIAKTSPYYAQFSHTSRLISRKEFKQALEEAKKLKDAMEKDPQFYQTSDSSGTEGSLLFTYNLIRIAALEKEAGSPVAELKAWEDLKKNMSGPVEGSTLKAFDPQATDLIQKNFQKQRISLADYIKYRESQLTALIQKNP